MERKTFDTYHSTLSFQSRFQVFVGNISSPKSREVGFYYSHPRNRFWTIIADLCSCDIPITKDEKIQFC